MYARFVSGHFKPENFEILTRTFDKEVLPLLKKQPGFRDELMFFDDAKKEAYAISFWDDKANLDKYEKTIYPKVHEKMEKIFSDTPKVRKFMVSNSTWHDIHA